MATRHGLDLATVTGRSRASAAALRGADPADLGPIESVFTDDVRAIVAAWEREGGCERALTGIARADPQLRVEQLVPLIVIDDPLLLAALSDTAPADVADAIARGECSPLAPWYWRLDRAVAAGSGSGSLSGRFQSLEAATRQRVVGSLKELPEQMGLLSLRTLVPVMQALAVTRSLNFLNVDALGAALLLDATITVSVDAPLSGSGSP